MGDESLRRVNLLKGTICTSPINGPNEMGHLENRRKLVKSKVLGRLAEVNLLQGAIGHKKEIKRWGAIESGSLI